MQLLISFLSLGLVGVSIANVQSEAVVVVAYQLEQFSSSSAAACLVDAHCRTR